MTIDDVIGGFNPEKALRVGSAPPPPAPALKAKPVRRSAALLVRCPVEWCRRHEGDWCAPDEPGQTRNVHEARLDLVAGEVTGPFSEERAMKARGA